LCSIEQAAGQRLHGVLPQRVAAAATPRGTKPLATAPDATYSGTDPSGRDNRMAITRELSTPGTAAPRTLQQLQRGLI